MEVYYDYYDRLANILPISNITARLVSTRIIDINDQEAISKLHTTKDKIEFVLIKVGQLLKSNATKNFLSLLEIMEEYGGEAATLASEIKSSLSCK